jgi:hypothetical protein
MQKPQQHCTFMNSASGYFEKKPVDNIVLLCVLDGKYMIHILAGVGDTHHILAMPGILLPYFIYRNKNVCSYFQRDCY